MTNNPNPITNIPSSKKIVNNPKIQKTKNTQNTFYFEESSSQQNNKNTFSKIANNKVNNSESMKETLKFGNQTINKKAYDKDSSKINNKTFDVFNYNSADIKKNSKLKFKHFNYEQNGRAYFV